MALDLKNALSRKTNEVDKDLREKIERGRVRLQKLAPRNDEAFEFYRGNHFAYLDEKGQLQLQPTVTSVRGTGKPKHRSRQARNIVYDVVLREAAAASQRVPSYQVVPSTQDPEDASAAKMAEKVALYGYRQWGVREATIDAVIHAVVGGEAFAWAYFDTSIGPFIEDEAGTVGQGDVRVGIYGGNECFWEPGLRFEASPWHAIEQAVPPDRVKEMPDYIEGPLQTDANMRHLGRRRTDKGKLTLITNYLELPCPDYPEGRWITIHNNREVVPERPYPGTECCLRKLAFAPDPDADRDLGLVPMLLDPQRTKNDAENKAVEAKNHLIFPRIFAPPGTFKKQRWTDEIGKVYEVPNPNENVKLVELGGIPGELFTMADRAVDDLLRIAGQADPPPGMESGRALAVWIEKNVARSALFVASLADWHSKVAHDCLVQVQEHYTEGRLIQIKGDFGWERVDEFRGADLRGQVDVRVFADSIEPRTRQAMEQRIMEYARQGWIDPQQAMTAIEQGTVSGIVRSFAQDESRVSRIIQRIKDGTIGEMPMMPTGRLQKQPATDPATGEPAIDPYTGQQQMETTANPEMAAGWMPRYSDNLGVFRTIFEDWMKTEDYEMLEPQLQDVAATIYAGVLVLESEKAAEQQAAQTAQAEQYGLDNAASGGNGKPLPSFPSLDGGAEKPAPPQ